MRKQAKPFKTEYKGRKPHKAVALFDEADVHAGDERPPRDVNDDLSAQHEGSYEEALRAADAVFGGHLAHEPSIKKLSVAPEEPREPEKRILQDLSYVDPLEARLANAKPSRRGRPLGSKNKPKAPSAPPTVVSEPPGPTVSAPVSNVVFRRRGIGFRQQVAIRTSLKPGERWKLKLRKLSRTTA